jgi:uncharacterized protein (TIGR02996 family)
MTHEDAFFQDILEHPDDDTPRLIFADWLDDHGDPDRAEFIRLQCRLARETDPLLPAVRDMRIRENTLFHQHNRTWAGPVVCSLAQGWGFRRGFVSFINASASQLVGHCDELFRAAPIQHLRLLYPRDFLADLLSSPQLVRLGFLDLHAGYTTPIGDDGLTLLAQCPYVKSLNGLLLNANDIGPYGITALTASPYLGQLRWLDLSANRLGTEGARLLATWPALSHLARLDVSRNNPPCSEVRRALTVRLGCRLVC